MIRPQITRLHPGYWKVLAGLLFTHLGMGLDGVLADHPRQVWTLADEVVGGQFWVWSILHFFVVAVILLGLYFPKRWIFLRVGCWVSAIGLNAFGVALLFGNVAHHYSSVWGPLACISISMSSVAAALEPMTNPAWKTRVVDLGAHRARRR